MRIRFFSRLKTVVFGLYFGFLLRIEVKLSLLLSDDVLTPKKNYNNLNVPSPHTLMFKYIAFTLSIFVTTLCAQDSLLVAQKGALILEDNFTDLNTEIWVNGKSKWKVENGVLIGIEPLGHNHTVGIGLKSIEDNFVVEVDIKFIEKDSTGGIMFDSDPTVKGKKEHLGRVFITPKSAIARRDKGATSVASPFKQLQINKWYKLTLEMVDDVMVGQINGEVH